MDFTFSDLHHSIVNNAKHGVPLPVEMTQNKKVDAPKITKPKKEKALKRKKKDISTQEIKQLINERKQSGCSICGYFKCLKALEFHHLDPKKKLFSLSRSSSRYSHKEITDELDKCVIVCSNCHKEIHDGLIKF